MSLPIRFQYGLPAIASFTENITGCIPRSKSRVKQIDNAKVFSVSYSLFLTMINITGNKYHSKLTKIKLRIGFFIVYNIEDIWCMFSANHI